VHEIFSEAGMEFFQRIFSNCKKFGRSGFSVAAIGSLATGAHTRPIVEVSDTNITSKLEGSKRHQFYCTE